MFYGKFNVGRGGRGCEPRGRQDRWDKFAADFATRWAGVDFDKRWEAAQRGEGRGRSRRMFDGGELKLVILQLIADEPRHGYDLIRAIEDLTGGAYAPSPGVVYPTLTLLDEMGLIEEQRSEGAKKRFAATDAGRRHLAENAEQVEALIARLKDLGVHRKRTEGGPIVRAMRNLHHAISNRVERGELSDDTLHDAAALIDEVAQKIERLR